MFQSSRVNNEASSTDITKDYNPQLSSVMKLGNKHVLAKLVMEKDLSFFFCQSKLVLGNINQTKTEGIWKRGYPLFNDDFIKRMLIYISRSCLIVYHVKAQLP